MLLAEWFKDKPDDHKIQTFTLPDKKNRLTDSVNGAHSIADRYCYEQDVYFAVGTLIGNLPSTRRAVYERIEGIGGLWIDVDIAGPGHKKTNIPASIDDALSFIADVSPFAPSAVIKTGGGMHLYWFFDTFMAFRDGVEEELESQSLADVPFSQIAKPRDREYQNRRDWLIEKNRTDAASLIRKWQWYIIGAAKARDLILDSTFDLTRVLRIPGTFNHKIKEYPRPVEEHECHAHRRYPPDAFREFLDSHDIPEPTIARLNITNIDSNIRLDPDAGPPMKKFAALRANEPRFDDSFLNKRQDFQDHSPSTYDLSIARFAVQADWSDQEIIDLMIYHRSERGHKLKLDNRQYYTRTVAMARTKSTQSQKQNEEVIMKPETEVIQQTRVSIGGTEPIPSLPDAQRDALLKIFSDRTGLSVSRIEVSGTKDKSWTLILGDKTKIPIGTTTNLISKTRFDSIVYDITLSFPFDIKPKQWKTLIQQVAPAVYHVAIPEENPEGAILGAICDYVWSSASEDQINAVPHKKPFIKDNQVYVNANHFMLNLEDYIGTSAYTVRQVANMLHDMGMVRRYVAVTDQENVRRSARYWSIDKKTLETRYEELEKHGAKPEE